MTKESLYTPETRRIIKRLPLNDEQSVRRNGGVPTDVTFINSVARFNGSSSFINIKSLVRYFGATPTFSLRFKLTINNASTQQHIFSSTNSGAINRWALEINGDTLRFGELGYDEASGSITTGDHDIICVSDAGTVDLYIDGVLQVGTTAPASFYANEGFAIGSRPGGGQVHFDGDIDEFTMYNYVFTAEEVANINENRRFRDLAYHGEQTDVEILTDPFTELSWLNRAACFSFNEGISFSSDGSIAGSMRRTVFWDTSKRYRISITVNYSGSAGFIPPYDGSVQPMNIGASGTYTYTYQPSAVIMYVYVYSGFTGTITAISIKEILVEETEEILNVSAQSGSINDRQGNALTLTNMSVFKDGDVRAMLFNGVDSMVDCGDPDPLTGDITIIAWFKMKSKGESNAGRIFDNGKLWIRQTANPLLYFSMSSNGGSNNAAGNTSSNDYRLNEWVQIVVTRNAVGIANFFINGKATGAADQNSGTPVAGTTNIIIGADDAGDNTFNGPIGEETRIKKGILTAQEISQLFSNERIKYGV